MKNSIERMAIASVFALFFGILFYLSLTAVLFHVFKLSQSVPVLELTVISFVVYVLCILVWLRAKSLRLVYLASICLSILGSIVIFAIDAGSYISSISMLIVCPLVSLGGWYLLDKLPVWVDGVYQRSPLKSILWMLLVVLALTQLIRLNYWVIDEQNDWNLGTWDPIAYGHLCMNAYIYAADLNRQGVDNIYEPSNYPGIREVETRETVDGLKPGDHYQYPPQFLLLPRFALMLTNSFDIIKIVWFNIQIVAFFLMSVWLALSFKSERRKYALWLIPISFASFPIFTNFQYGQFHLFSVMLGVAGLLLFEKKRYTLGGASLGFAILSKIAPIILLIWLVAQRKWKEVAYTVVACCVYTIVAVLVIGVEPFISFFTDHIPNLQSGKAFDFANLWPELRELFLVLNLSPIGTISKLNELGVPGMTESVGHLVHNIYSLCVIGLAVFAGVRLRNSKHSVLIGLALINLASLTGKGAWVDYIGVGTIWLLTCLALDLSKKSLSKFVYISILFFLAISCGTYQVEEIGYFPTTAILTVIGTIVLIYFNVWFVLQKQTYLESDKS